MRLLFVGYDSRLPLSIERHLGYSTLFFGINKLSRGTGVLSLAIRKVWSAFWSFAH